MTHYTKIKMQISEGQKDKIKKEFESNNKSIKIRFKFSDLYGEDVIVLTKSKLHRIVEAYEENKGTTIRMSKTQLAHNMKIEGGFLPALAGLVPNWNCLASFRVWSFVRTEEHGGTKKLIGNGLYLKKGSGVCRIETDGEGLYLEPVSGKGFETLGNGLYLMKQGGLYDGRGVILGPNSPFKNIPILGMIL